MKAKRSFPKKQRLLKSAEFKRVYERGVKISGGRIQFLFLPNTCDTSRLGIAVGRRFGKAIRRNQLKRRLREAVRQNWRRVQAGFDVVAFPRRQRQEIGFQEVQADVLHLCNTLKSWKRIGPSTKNDSAQP